MLKKGKKMKSICSKVFYIFLFLCICSKAVSQDEMDKYCGVWKRLYSDEVFIRNNKSDTLRQPCGNDEPLQILLNDGSGYYVNANQRNDIFLWSVKNNAFSYKDSLYEKKNIMAYIENDKNHDLLVLKYSYKRKTYKYVDYLLRDNIKLMPLDDMPETKWNKKDTEFAYKNRIIEDQIPRVTFGYYDEKAHTLYIELTFYEYVQRPKQYDNLELFVIGNRKETKNNISSFLISYSSKNDSIINVSKIKDYYNERSYDNVNL